MSDPISAAASVAGLVSLGLQVVSGITKYLDAIRERKDDIASVKTQVIRTHALLQLVAQVATKAELNHSTTAAFLKDSASIKPELHALDELVRKLDTTKLPRPRHEIKGKVNGQAKKLTYPFHRPTMDRLQSRLIRVNDALYAALQVSSLDVALDIERATSAIQSTLPDLARQLSDDIKQENLASRDAVACVADSLVALSGNLDQGLAKVREDIATTSTASMLALDEDHAEKHSRLIQELSITQKDLSSLSNAVKGVNMGIVKVQEDIATTSTASVSLLRKDHAETQAKMLQGFIVTQSGVSEMGENVKRIELALRALPTREEVGRLLSKPSQLKEICDNMEETTGLTDYQHFNHHPRINLARRICVCRKRVVKSRQMVLWGPWQALADTSTAHDHLPGCIYYSQHAVASTKRLAVAFRGLQRVVNRAIEVSFSYSFGAGGFSLSPSFTYYPTIDRRRDPAFRIMALFCMACWAMNRGSYDPYLGAFLEQCMVNTALLYRCGKASPKAVDLHGRGILHYIGFHPTISIDRYNLLDRLDVLVKYGVQTAMYDIYGATPAWNMTIVLMNPRMMRNTGREGFDFAAALSNVASFSLLSDFLCAREPGMPPATKSELELALDGNVSLRTFSMMRHSPATAEAFGCGPLSLAALQGDIKQIDLILTNYPNAINEVNQLGQTPLHLAVGHSSCVALLLRESGSKLLDSPDGGGWRAIVYALFSCCSTYPGETQHQEGCTRNHGDTSLNILLDADCMIPMIESWPRHYDTLHEHSLCENCLLAVTKHFISRREGLKMLAANNLPRIQATELGLFRSSLFNSITSTMAIQALKEYGISVPPSLQVNGRPRCELDSPYHYRGPLPYPALWSLGYRDLETSSFDGTPLMHWSTAILWNETAAGICCWLIEKGADLWKLAPDGVSTISHELYSGIGARRRLPEMDEDEERRHILNLTQKLSHRNPHDSCRCACSPGGCTPFVRFLQAMRHRPTFGDIISPSELIEHFLTILEESHTTVTQDQMRSAIRYVTFEILRIRHTCCHADPHRRNEHRRDKELGELNQENCVLVAYLEDLTSDFQVELGQIQQERYVNKRVSFWYDYWLPRMQQALEVIEGAITEWPEKAAAEDLGVVWDEHRPDKGKGRDEGLDFSSEYDSGSVDGGYQESDWDSDIDEEAMFDTFQTMEDWTSRLALIMTKAGLSAGR